MGMQLPVDSGKSVDRVVQGLVGRGDTRRLDTGQNMLPAVGGWCPCSQFKTAKIAMFSMAWRRNAYSQDVLCW